MARNNRNQATPKADPPTGGEGEQQSKAEQAAEKKADKAPKGVTVLIAPEDCTSFGHDGEEFEVDSDGTVTVPDHVAVVLVDHGFRKAK